MEELQKLPSLANIVSKKTTFECHEFQHDILGKPVKFSVLKMTRYLIIWVGNTNNFRELSLGMLAPNDSIPVVTNIIGNDMTNISFTKKLTKRLNKPVYFSCSLNKDLFPEVEKRLAQEISEHPEKF